MVVKFDDRLFSDTFIEESLYNKKQIETLQNYGNLIYFKEYKSDIIDHHLIGYLYNLHNSDSDSD